jgi:hypothetical protein
MDAAKDGASMVFKELADGDLVSFSGFNDQVKDLSGGITRVDAAT